MKLLREFGLNLLVIGVGFLIGFLILEGVIRIVESFSSESRVPSIETVNAKGETIYTPNMDAMRAAEDTDAPSVRVYTNADGFVGKAYPKEGTAGETRIAALGDSFTAAVGVNTDKNFVSQLEQSMGVPVMNFGVGGQGTVEQLLRYERTVSEWKHDVVVVFFFGNDFENNQFYLPYRDRFTQGADRESVPLSNANNNLGRKDLKYLLLKSSKALQLVDRKVRENATLEAIAVKIGLHHAGAMGLPTDGIHPAFFMYQTPIPEAQEEVFEFTGSVFESLKASVESHGARLAVVYLPEATAVDGALWGKKKAALSSLEKYSWNFDQPNTFLKEALARQGIPFLDLTPVFRNALSENPDTGYYANGEGHFNEIGHELVSGAVRPFLEEVLNR